MSIKVVHDTDLGESIGVVNNKAEVAKINPATP